MKEDGGEHIHEDFLNDHNESDPVEGRRGSAHRTVIVIVDGWLAIISHDHKDRQKGVHETIEVEHWGTAIDQIDFIIFVEFPSLLKECHAIQGVYIVNHD